MRTARFAFSLAVFALVFSSSYAAHRQVVIDSGGVSQAPGERGEPYTAVRKTTNVQKLADGTTITHETIRKEAHDSSGRAYIEIRPEIPAGLEEQAPEQVMYSVVDPVNRILINWSSNSKVANVSHMPEPTQIPRVQPPQPPPISPAASPRVSQRPIEARPDIERLGTKTINGIEAEGTRMTRIIPAGREGNDRPITVITETWRSPELPMVVMSINDDPRSGTTTVELTDFERGEPDPALFQAPEGYTVNERFPDQPN